MQWKTAPFLIQFFSSCNFFINPTSAEFGGYGDGGVRRRLSITERSTAVTLPSYNWRRHNPSCEKLRPAWILPHGLLPWYNCSWSCYGGFQLPQHKEGSRWEVEGQPANQTESRLSHLLPLYGPVDPTPFYMYIPEGWACIFPMHEPKGKTRSWQLALSEM